MTTTLSSIQRAVVEEDVRGRLNDQARLALQSIDRLVRSGNILYDPVDESGNDPFDSTATGFLFRIYTQAEQAENEDLALRALAQNEQQLLYRTWPVLDPGRGDGLGDRRGRIVNRDLDELAFTARRAAGRSRSRST